MDNEVYELPVSFAQRRIWLLDQLDPDGRAYLVPWRVRLTGVLRREALDAALADVVARHESLRTVFRAVDGQPVQVVGGAGPRLSYVDLSGSAAPEDEAAALATTAAGERFDLGRDPLLRATLVRLAPDRHELILVAHHAVVDGWSIGLLLAELAGAYRARVNGVAPTLPELPVQYGDVALWQQDHWRDGGFADDEDYWRAELSGAPTTLTLPTERPRPAHQSHRGATVRFDCDAELTDGVRQLARTAGTTPFVVLLAAFCTVLSRYSGAGDLLVGVPVSGRTRPETANLIGLFMNTLALRARLTDNPPFATLVDRLRQVTAGALAHQELPFDRVVELLAPERSLAQSPVAQVLFALDEPAAAVDAAGVHWEPSIVDNHTAKLDLSLTMTDVAGALSGRLTYDTELFGPVWTERFVDCFLAVVRAAVARPEVRVGDIEVVTGALRETVLTGWGARPASQPGDLLALVGPGQGAVPAVVAGEVTLSRDEVTRWSGQVAALLRAHGVGPDLPVGLCLPRSAALVPALLGIWAAGGGYVPLDPGYPVARLRAMVADSGLRVLLTDGSLASLAAEVCGPEVTVLRVEEAGALTPAAPLTVGPQALAYTIFTSGSTGRPKGVSVPRGAVEAMLRAFRDSLGLGTADRLVAVTTLSFDIAVLELLLPLACGARVVLADTTTAADGGLLRELLLRSGATAMQATPATWRMLDASGGVPVGVRLRLCGGEALPPDLVPVLLAGDAHAWNVYGPTETTVWSAAGAVRPAPAPVEIGPPIAGTTIRVLDRAMRPVPPGVVGEVYLGGAGVARGYHGQPGLTADRFVPDPFATVPGARLYRTGDLARWRDSGLLDLIGRADQQVKVRGFRIETGEIEAVLCGHSSVAQAVVTVHDTQLVAYVVPPSTMDTTAVDAAALRRHLAVQLPDYMIPSGYVALAALPLTPNGKVDRSALPDPVWEIGATAEVAEPATPVQRRLLGLWREVLPLAGAIGVHDNFFALGGHSLTATQLIARIRSEFGTDLRLRALFEHPTVAELATLLGEAESPTGSTVDGLEDLTDADLDDLLQTLTVDD